MRSRFLLAVPLLISIAIGALGYLHVGGIPGAAERPLPPALAAPPSPLGLPPPGAELDAWFFNTTREARRDGTLLFLAAIIFVATLLRLVVPEAQRHLRTSVFFFFFYLTTIPVGSILVAGARLEPYVYVRGLALLLLAVAGTSLVSILLFDILMSIVRVPVKPILREVLTGAAYILVGASVLSRAGVNLSGLVTGSAVMGAVIAFSINNTLGDVLSGIILEWENAVEVGDWVRVGEVTGQVKEIRWRHIRIESRNWESIIMPNSMLMKTHVLLLGHRTHQPIQWRRWIYFQCDYKFPPTKVMGVVEEALQNCKIDRVASDPPPNCILFDFKEYAPYYAVRYWLTELLYDDGTDSVVRTRIYYALHRAGIEFSVPIRHISMSSEDEAARAREAADDHTTRLAALRRFGLFSMLTDKELEALVPHLAHAPFAKSEIMTRQGAEAHWLYLLLRGEASVHVRLASGDSTVVSRIKSGDFFGEMALLTGDRRSATVIADADCDCWRLDREAFREIVLKRPEIAEELSRILAARRIALQEVHAQAGSQAQSLAAAQHDVLTEIKEFFGLVH
ncbi:MAG: mechanosensitive ion channel [Planctomycetes bacterium]|nr:mechanosensitive ion channel [Planctomycetota bacterium]